MPNLVVLATMDEAWKFGPMGAMPLSGRDEYGTQKPVIVLNLVTVLQCHVVGLKFHPLGPLLKGAKAPKFNNF